MVDYTYWKDLTSQTNEFGVLAQFNIFTLLISYFVHSPPPKFFDIIIVFIVSRVVQSSQEKLNQKKIHMHFSFLGVRLVAKKAYHNGGLLKKKASLLGWNLFHKLYTLVFGSLVDLCRCNFNSSTSYFLYFYLFSIHQRVVQISPKKLGLWSNSYGISCLTVVGL